MIKFYIVALVCFVLIEWQVHRKSVDNRAHCFKIYIYKFQILLRIRKYVKLKFQTNKTLNLRLKLLKN